MKNWSRQKAGASNVCQKTDRLIAIDHLDLFLATWAMMRFIRIAIEIYTTSMPLTTENAKSDDVLRWFGEIFSFIWRADNHLSR